MAKVKRSYVYSGLEGAAISAAYQFMCQREGADPISTLYVWAIERLELLNSTRDYDELRAVLRWHRGEEPFRQTIRLIITLTDRGVSVTEQTRSKRRKSAAKA